MAASMNLGTCMAWCLQHKQKEVSAAVTLEDLTSGPGVVFGSMLACATYGDDISHKKFEACNHNLAVLLKV